eukprot:gene13432-biopygen3513
MRPLPFTQAAALTPVLVAAAEYSITLLPTRHNLELRASDHPCALFQNHAPAGPSTLARQATAVCVGGGAEGSAKSAPCCVGGVPPAEVCGMVYARCAQIYHMHNYRAIFRRAVAGNILSLPKSGAIFPGRNPSRKVENLPSRLVAECTSMALSGTIPVLQGGRKLAFRRKKRGQRGSLFATYHSIGLRRPVPGGSSTV